LSLFNPTLAETSVPWPISHLFLAIYAARSPLGETLPIMTIVKERLQTVNLPKHKVATPLAVLFR
jgi:hypothetical protein